MDRPRIASGILRSAQIYPALSTATERVAIAPAMYGRSTSFVVFVIGGNPICGDRFLGGCNIELAIQTISQSNREKSSEPPRQAG